MTEEKEKEYQEAIEHLIGMNRHYLKFIEKSEETDPLRIEQKEDFIDIINQHLEKYKHLLPKIDKEKELKRIDDMFKKQQQHENY